MLPLLPQQLVEVGGGPCCEVEHKGKTVRVTPSDVMTRIYAKLLGLNFVLN